jgi:teichuronic acid biosynthesis glycosyltransferase TuaG
MRDDLVSIITPAYRAAGVIEDTIRSVVAQTYPQWELLIADDCSPDQTRAVVTKWTERDPRIRLIALSENGGPAHARNASLAAASGRWAAFLDSDDLWAPDKLEKQLAFHRRVGAPLSFTAFRRISADGRRIGRLIRVPGSLDYEHLLGNTAIATSTVLVDLASTGPLRMKKIYYDDFGCWLDILRGGGMARGLNEDMMRYRVLDKSVSRNKRNSAKQVWKIYREVENLGLARSAWHFARYGWNGLRKYGRF